MKLSNKTYDFLKWVALIGLPALATFVSVVGVVWALPYTTEIVGTLVAIDTFLGGLLGVSTANYNKG